MGINFRSWPGIAGLFGLSRSQPTGSPAAQESTLDDLAFELATANEISETLPGVIRRCQQQLQQRLPAQPDARLLVLFSNSLTAESFLHHADEQPPAARLIQQLHRTFTLSKTTPATRFKLPLQDSELTVDPQPLLKTGNQEIWLLYTFRGEAPGEQQLIWRTSPIEQALKRGIGAWYQREEKVQAALKAERAIYAAELHDSLAQVLGYLRLKSARLDKLCQQPDYAELKPITEDLAAYTHCAYRQARELITSSRLTLQSESLSEGVINSIREFEQQSGIVFELDNRVQLNLLTARQSMQVLYIIRESLSNIVRHSHASHARVSMTLRNNRYLQILIEDNGQGINPDAARNDSFGIQIMHERAERINAELRIEPRPGGGTRTLLNLDAGEENE